MIFRKYTCFLIACIFCIKVSLNAQEFSLQLTAGVMNYGGDIQSQAYTFTQSHPTVGINAFYGVKNVALRAGFAFGEVSAQDKLTTDLVQRNLSFKSNIIEGSLSLEYDFFSAEKDYKLIPYIFAGIGFYHFNPYTYYNSQKVYLQPLGTEGEGLSMYPNRKLYALSGFEDPYGVGVRYKITPDLLLGVEYNGRLLFTDYLDDVSRTYPDRDELFKERGQLAVDLSYRGDPTKPFPSGNRRGNPHQNDTYYSSVVTLTYIFPQRSSSFGNSFHSKRSSKFSACPKKVH